MKFTITFRLSAFLVSVAPFFLLEGVIAFFRTYTPTVYMLMSDVKGEPRILYMVLLFVLCLLVVHWITYRYIIKNMMNTNLFRLEELS